MILKCEVCTSDIGKIKVDKLSFPLTADMFGSLDDGRGMPVPFFMAPSWEHFRCPMCGVLPFLQARDEFVCPTSLFIGYKTVTTSGMGRVLVQRRHYIDPQEAEAARLDLADEESRGVRYIPNRQAETKARRVYRCEPCDFTTTTPVALAGHKRSARHKELTGEG